MWGGLWITQLTHKYELSEWFIDQNPNSQKSLASWVWLLPNDEIIYSHPYICYFYHILAGYPCFATYINNNSLSVNQTLALLHPAPFTITKDPPPPKAEYRATKPHCHSFATGSAGRSARLQKVKSTENVCNCIQKFFLEKDYFNLEDITGTTQKFKQ